MRDGFIHSSKIVRHNGAVAAGTSDIDPSAGVDCNGFDSVTFIVAFGAITASAVTSIKLQQSSDDGSSDAYTDVAGTSVTVADDDDNQYKYVELINPQERYVKCYVTRGTANAVVDGIVAVLHGAGNQPTTQPTGVEGEIHNTAVAGTA